MDINVRLWSQLCFKGAPNTKLNLDKVSIFDFPYFFVWEKQEGKTWVVGQEPGEWKVY